MTLIKKIVMALIAILTKVLTTDESKIIIQNEVKKLIDSETDGVTSDIAYVMMDAIVKSEMNDITVGMVSKALNKLKTNIE
jgi:hypothetical protein